MANAPQVRIPYCIKRAVLGNGRLALRTGFSQFGSSRSNGAHPSRNWALRDLGNEYGITLTSSTTRGHGPTESLLMGFVKHTIGISRGDLTRDCLQQLRLWPGCQTVQGIAVLGDLPGRFT